MSRELAFCWKAQDFNRNSVPVCKAVRPNSPVLRWPGQTSGSHLFPLLAFSMNMKTHAPLNAAERKPAQRPFAPSRTSSASSYAIRTLRLTYQRAEWQVSWGLWRQPVDWADANNPENRYPAALFLRTADLANFVRNAKTEEKSQLQRGWHSPWFEPHSPETRTSRANTLVRISRNRLRHAPWWRSVSRSVSRSDCIALGRRLIRLRARACA